MVLAEGQEAHWEVVERILFIYVKLNPGQGYVQVDRTTFNYLPRRRRPGTGDIATPPVCLSVCLSVRLSVCPSVRHV